jgi:hypothetical protein
MSSSPQGHSPIGIGFFSYSREDDEDSGNQLSEIRELIQREFRSQIGLPRDKVRLWQDREAIAYGKNWENEIRDAIERSVFFIPIVTPSAINSRNCKLEFEAFLQREAELERNDLVFPIYYIRVPALEREHVWRSDPVLKIIGVRQFDDWRSLRSLDVRSSEVRHRAQQFCSKIVEALWALEEDLQRKLILEARRKAEEEDRRLKAEAHAKRKAAEEERRLRAEADAKRMAEEDERRLKAEADAKRKAEEEERRLKTEADAKRMAEDDERRLKAEADAKRKAAEEKRRLKTEADAKRKAEEEERRLKSEADAKRRAEEEACWEQAEAEVRRKREEERGLKMEAEAKRKAEDERSRVKTEGATEASRVEPYGLLKPNRVEAYRRWAGRTATYSLLKATLDKADPSRVEEYCSWQTESSNARNLIIRSEAGFDYYVAMKFDSLFIFDLIRAADRTRPSSAALPIQIGDLLISVGDGRTDSFSKFDSQLLGKVVDFDRSKIHGFSASFPRGGSRVMRIERDKKMRDFPIAIEPYH